jgi:hypothetical protein
MAAAPVAVAALGCASTVPDPRAFDDRTFYEYNDGSPSGSADSSSFEEDYPPLDLAGHAPVDFHGVTLLRHAVHLSRPTNWVLLAANNRPERRFIRYVSPNAYVFAIYELVDSPNDTWRDIMERYEQQAKSDGAEILGSRVPMATWNAQGRAYVVKRRVKAAKGPFVSISREFLARSEHRIVLVQVVHEGDDLGPLSDELLRVVQTLEVL